MTFLLDFIMKRPDHILQVAEVLNILLSSDDWLQHLHGDWETDGATRPHFKASRCCSRR